MSTAPPFHSLDELWEELWVSMASLLRSYTAVHGLSDGRQADIEQNEERIVARHGDKCLTLERKGATVKWIRNDGSSGELQLTVTGSLENGQGAEEMDLTAEAWARELMNER
ncbi:MAG: transcriptional regulator [Terracidiphilus sp.]